jgi:peptide deformylase
MKTEFLNPGEKQSLRQKSYFPTLEEIKEKESTYLEYKSELEKYINEHSLQAAGLALPQWGENVAVFSLKLGNQVETVFSPKIISKGSKEYLYTEGCLSFPGISCLIKRPNSVDVSYYVFEKNQWKQVKTKLTDIHEPNRIRIWARVFQHEYDHLIGVPMLDSGIQLAPTEKTKVMKIDSDIYGLDYYIEGENVLIFANKEIVPQDYPDSKIVGIYERKQ